MNKKNIMIIVVLLSIIIALPFGINAYINYKVDEKIISHLGAGVLGRCEKLNYNCAKQAMENVGFFDKVRFMQNDSECFEDNTRKSIKDNEKFIKVFVSCSLQNLFFNGMK